MMMMTAYSQKMLMVMINVCNENDYLEQKMKEMNRTQLSHPKGS